MERTERAIYISAVAVIIAILVTGARVTAAIDEARPDDTINAPLYVATTRVIEEIRLLKALTSDAIEKGSPDVVQAVTRGTRDITAALRTVDVMVVGGRGWPIEVVVVR